MKKILVQLCLAALLFTGFTVQSCKSKKKESDNTTTTTTTTDNTANTTAPVTVANDEELRRGVRDATKDFPTVNATVQDSVIILSGTIKRSDNQRLTQTLNSLHPKRIDRANLKVQ
ncbi:MAG: hypothetical protein ICV81_12355 [Flavisolibacter sp.]|nr:hypothetical protein [Flavisolibacter sp.]MBD0285296.1 hypothetical protein [Flavisolibacter sp.]MBD0365583.1 hypothetical protein [Flavisolibacter sp.]